MALLRFRVLGQLQIIGNAGETHTIRSRRQRSILAALLAKRGDPVSRDHLIEAAWHSRPPAEPFNALMTQISRIRRLLPPETIETKWPGYALQVDPTELDATMFSKLVSEAKSHRASDPHQALRLVDEAIALWRGDPYAGLTDDPYVVADVVRLRELRMVAEEERLAALLDTGRHDEAIPALEAFVATNPLRDQPVTLLMTALHNAGRRDDALSAYSRHRQTLAAELGIDPSLAVQELEQQIRSNRPSAQRRRWPAPPARRLVDVEYRLPTWRNALLGRAYELERINTLVREHSLITVVGPGGVGKTRLAVEAAHRLSSVAFADGIFFCVLDTASNQGDVIAAVARSTGRQLYDDELTVDALAERCSDLHALIILDNCEHLTEHIRSLISGLIDSCPFLTIVATTREILGLPGEHIVEVRPLTVPETPSLDAAMASPAVRLFLDRATASGGFRLTESNVADVVRICRRLDGIPLALELAASQLRGLRPKDLAMKIGPLMHPDTDGTRDADHRQHTLSTLVAWSHDLLTEKEQIVFRRMSVFVGPCSMEAIIQTCGGDGVDAEEVGQTVHSLVNRSMVKVEEATGTALYGVYEVFRKFGARKLKERGEAHSTRDQHASYFSALATVLCQRSIHTWSLESLVSPLTENFDNFGAALAWCLENDATAERALPILCVSWFGVGERSAREITDFAEAAIDRWGPLTEAIGVAATGHVILGRTALARLRANQAVAAEDRSSHAPPYGRRALAYYYHFVEGDHVAALQQITDAISRARNLGRDLLACEMELFHAQIVAATGGRGEAIAIAERATRESLTRRSAWEVVWGRFLLGSLNIEVSLAKARVLLEQAIKDGQAIGCGSAVGCALRAMAVLCVAEDRVEDAILLHRRAIEHFRRDGDPQQQRLCIAAMLPLLVKTSMLPSAATIVGAVEGPGTPCRPSPAFTPLFFQAKAELTVTMEADEYQSYLHVGGLLTDHELIGEGLRCLDKLAHVEDTDSAR